MSCPRAEYNMRADKHVLRIPHKHFLFEHEPSLRSVELVDVVNACDLFLCPRAGFPLCAAHVRAVVLRQEPRDLN